MDQLPIIPPTPGTPTYDALEDPEQLKTLTIEMLLGIYDGHLSLLREKEVKIRLGMGMANGLEEREAQVKKYAMLRKTFRLDRDQIVVDIYRREIIRRMQEKEKSS